MSRNTLDVALRHAGAAPLKLSANPGTPLELIGRQLSHAFASRWRTGLTFTRRKHQSLVEIFAALSIAAFAPTAIAGSTELESSTVMNPVALVTLDAAEGHRLASGMRQPIVIDGLTSAAPIWLELIVDSSGRVRSAVPIGGPETAFPEAVAQAETWSYTPLVVDGTALAARFVSSTFAVPPVKGPVTHLPFPDLSPTTPVAVTLERDSFEQCGPCRDYTVEVQGDGNVVFMGKHASAFTGRYTDRIASALVSDLIEQFQRADFYSLEDDYPCLTRGPEGNRTTISIAIGEQRKSVTQKCRIDPGMPPAVSDLMKLIDRVVGTDKWVSGTAESVDSLKHEGYDFASAEVSADLAHLEAWGTPEGVHAFLAAAALIGDDPSARKALKSAIAHDDRETAVYLLDHGVAGQDLAERTELLHAAAIVGDADLVELLARTGVDMNSRSSAGWSLLAEAAASGNVDFIKAMIRRFPNVNRPEEHGRTPIFGAIPGMIGLPVPGRIGRAPVDPAPAIRLLAASGADLNRQDDTGATPLHYAADGKLELAQLSATRALLELRGKLNIRDVHGRTPLLSAKLPSIALMLLQAGADPTIRDQTGKSIRDIAISCGKQSDSPVMKMSADGWREILRITQ